MATLELMHTRRLSSLLLGAWLAGSLFMWMVATQNFRSVDRLLESPSPQASTQFDKLGRDGARTLLRYHVGEQNRWYFETWELAQIVVGALLIAASVERSATASSASAMLRALRRLEREMFLGSLMIAPLSEASFKLFTNEVLPRL